jgi:hypothetical protein
MSDRPQYMPEDPLKLKPGVLEMLNDTNHYRVTEMHCIDYSQYPPEPDPDVLPSLATPPAPAPRPSFRQRLSAAVKALVG